MAKVKPTRRDTPKTGGLSQPHVELLGDAQLCIHALSKAREQSYRRYEELDAAGDSVGAQLALGSVEAQMYSRLVQILCAMSVEAALNCYGLWFYGEDEYERYFERMPTAQKLRELIELTHGVRLAATDEIVSVVQSLTAKRNAHVHLRAEESRPDASGVFKPTIKNRPPARSDAAAAQAAEEANRFFELFAPFARNVPMAFDLLPPPA